MLLAPNSVLGAGGGAWKLVPGHVPEPSIGFEAAVGPSKVIHTSGGYSSAAPKVLGTTKLAWRVAPSANATANDDLSSVSCPRGGFCLAVGRYFLYSPQKCQEPVTQTLTERWDGTAWSAIGSPNAGCSNNELYSVSCPRPDTCTAVGAFVGNSTWQTLILVLTGGQWTIVPSPNVGSGTNVLNSVSCVGTSFCTAVGGWSDAVTGTARALIESWNGTSWSVVPSANPGGTDYALDGVSCTSATWCQAVGIQNSGPGNFSALIEAWDGKAWSAQAGAFKGALNGVTCVSITFCTAVGYSESSFPYATLVEEWNGVSWLTVLSPNVPGNFSALASVSCTSNTACVAVGYAGNFVTLVEVWRGRSWVISPSPNVGSGSNLLKGVSCIAAGRCKAVGAYQSSPSEFQTLVEVSPVLVT
jgi:hypothetical protein